MTGEFPPAEVLNFKNRRRPKGRRHSELIGLAVERIVGHYLLRALSHALESFAA